MKDLALAAWRFRHFMLASIRGELKGRFARSRIGALWFVLHPLAQATIFALVLAEVLGARLGISDNKAAYAIYLMAGLAAWGLFTEIVNRCLTVFLEYANTLKKISFPRICLPLIVWGSALVTHVLLLGAILVVFLFFGHRPGPAWLAIPVGIALISMFAFGLGLFLGVLNVFVRDVGQVMSVLLQVWFWLTPIVYTLDVLPKGLRAFVDLNPLVPLVRLYQDALLFDRWPQAYELLSPTLWTFGLLALSFVVFRRASSELVDVL
jgi:lipopolysaccharide transport system permease protein